MDGFDWQTLLEAYSRELLASENFRDRLPPEATKAEWMGFGGEEEEIAELETRLDIRLPPSYRGFLGVSNGWRHPGPFVYDLWPADQVVWFEERNQSWIDAFVGPQSQSPYLSDEECFVYGEEQSTVWFRAEYLQSALQISEEGDSAVYLLNPKVVTPEGEWEAWFLANWSPGAMRYRSFLEMMQDERDNFLRLLRDTT